MPYKTDRRDQVVYSTNANDFSSYFQSSGSIGTAATLAGPVGSGSKNFVSVETPQTYTLQLQQEVSKAAAQVRILTQLDTDLDARTFQLGDIQLGDISVHIPDGRFKFDGDFDFTQTKGFVLHVSSDY